MDSPLTRRGFLGQSARLGAGLATAPLLSRLATAGLPSRRVRVGVMGLGRGQAHLLGYGAVPGVEIAYVCDVDRRRLAVGEAMVRQRQSAPVQAVTDFRRILDDPTIDAISIAAPSHWHTPATLLALEAGKHVYVEKPGSHNAEEAGWIVAATRRHGRLVQLGAQRRSNPAYLEAVARLRSQVIGPVRFAKCFYGGSRGTIGIGREVPVPPELDYDLWEGPAPHRPYRSNVVPYNWHWRWHWGGGELANTGVHFLDVARWGLGVDWPQRVTCSGGRYGFRDDQETPDTGTATFDFGDKAIAMEWSSCQPRKAEPLPLCAFYGDGGSLALHQHGLPGRHGYTVYDLAGKEVARSEADFDDVSHFANFIDAIRGRAALRLEIADGEKSAMLCHLGNIALRSGQTVAFDPSRGRASLTPEQAVFWGREYRPGWRPRV